MLSFKDIAKIFEEIELKLISSLKRNLHRHKAWEKDEGFQWSAWQAEKLRNLNKFRQENFEIVNDYVDVIDDETRQLMEEQFHEGEKLAEEIVEDAVPSRVTDNHFFGINERKMDALMEDVTTIEKKAETAALRMVDDVYRQTVNKVQLEMATGSTTLTKAIDDAVSDFLDKGINCIVYKDGKRVNVADYVRMVLRTTSARATLQGEAKRRTELGFDTVLVSQYGMCSETCLPWQGQVYIDDVFTEWRGERVSDRGKSNYCGKWFTLLSVAISNGLFHPNCRHTMSTYIDGVTQIPKPIDEKLIKKQRELEQKQRALEKKVRKFKRLEAGTQSPETAKAYRKELREAQHELKVFVDEHNDVLRRDYSRERNYGEGLTKSEEDAIIIRELRQCGIVGRISLNPEKIDTLALSIDLEHINERRHEVSFEDAISFIEKSRFSVSRWNGKFENYFSDSGASYVDAETKTIRTAFVKEEFNENIIKALEVLNKYGR
ncbi:MAG: hypothetical protein IJX42_02315 [Oscillospiraceae bacterium]|nr:hypothetical protein [Oscillospiraceae bacterium]MBQ8377945.1 hypothetical protein [Oscillospiraceae bacterium]